MIESTRPDLKNKIADMRILDHNPNKPVVRMANLCVVSGHTVRCLHSKIVGGTNLLIIIFYIFLERTAPPTFCAIEGSMDIIFKCNSDFGMYSFY